jgi:RNA polymerase sporulation-specific sigma factor
MDIVGEDAVTDPEEMYINREEIDCIGARMGELLSGLEKDVLSLYLKGRSYMEIAHKLDRHVKSIDNALQRVKRKLERYLDDSTVV